MKAEQIEELQTIGAQTKVYAQARQVLADRVARLQDEIQAAKRRLLPGIKSAAAKAADAKGDLVNMIEASPELFVKPRSVTIEGIKVGLQKAKGKITFADADAVVKAIRKHLPERFDELVQVVEKPKKPAINALSVAEAKKIGCTVTEDSDEVLIKATGDDIDKIVAKILEEEDGES